MDGWLCIGGFVVLLVVSSLTARPRFRTWRGPTAGTREEVQWEHLDLFLPYPTEDQNEEDDL